MVSCKEQNLYKFCCAYHGNRLFFFCSHVNLCFCCLEVLLTGSSVGISSPLVTSGSSTSSATVVEQLGGSGIMKRCQIGK